MQTLAVGLVYSSKEYLVGCMNRTVHSYSLRAKHSFVISLPAPILAMHGLAPPQQKATKCLLVSLANGSFALLISRQAVAACSVYLACMAWPLPSALPGHQVSSYEPHQCFALPRERRVEELFLTMLCV